jgi:hypothetical protein
VSNGVKRRNARLTSLRRLTPGDAGIVGSDLAEDEQVVIISDHDAGVLDPRRFPGNVRHVITVLPWAAKVARGAGFARVVLACDPPGRRWTPPLPQARDTGLDLVCVTPMLVARARDRRSRRDRPPTPRGAHAPRS